MYKVSFLNSITTQHYPHGPVYRIQGLMKHFVCSGHMTCHMTCFGHMTHLNILHFGVLVEHLLHFQRVDVLSTTDDEVLDATHNPPVAVVVKGRQVSIQTTTTTTATNLPPQTT